MSVQMSSAYRSQFEDRLDDLIAMSDIVRSLDQLGPSSKYGHTMNENTLVRIHTDVEAIRESLQGKWILSYKEWGNKTTEEKQRLRSKDEATPGFDAYVTMCVYRNSIIHHQGTLNEEFYEVECAHHGMGNRSKGRRRHYKGNYDQFCRSVGVEPLQPGDKLLLSVRSPDFLLKLVEGIGDFARSVLKD